MRIRIAAIMPETLRSGLDPGATRVRHLALTPPYVAGGNVRHAPRATDGRFIGGAAQPLCTVTLGLAYGEVGRAVTDPYPSPDLA